MKHFNYNKDVPAMPAGEGVTRKILAYSDNLMVCEVAFDEGAVGALHSHFHEQMTYIVEGKFKFTIGEEERIVGPGDCLAKEPDIVHGCVCLEKGKLIDIFTPARKDFFKEDCKMKKIALITGGTGGIGLAVAEELGKAGYSIILNGIDDAAAEVALKKLRGMGIEADYYHFDVTNEEEIVKSMEIIRQKYDHLDVLINNAGGLGGRSRLEELPTDFYRRVMALNLDSAVFMTREAIPMLKKSPYPSIVNYASNAAYNAGGPGAGIYATAKAGIVTFTRASAKDLAEYGIRVNCVSPGTIDTPFHDETRKKNPQLFESWKQNILLKRFGKPEEVAAVIGFLVSEKASFITGEVIQINGGQDLL